jgi:hypothetical protein
MSLVIFFSMAKPNIAAWTRKIDFLGSACSAATIGSPPHWGGAQLEAQPVDFRVFWRPESAAGLAGQRLLAGEGSGFAWEMAFAAAKKTCSSRDRRPFRSPSLPGSRLLEPLLAALRVTGARVRSLRGRLPAACCAPTEYTQASMLRGRMIAAE